MLPEPTPQLVAEVEKSRATSTSRRRQCDLIRFVQGLLRPVFPRRGNGTTSPATTSCSLMPSPSTVPPMLALDGVYAGGDAQPLRFYRLPPPSDAGVAQVAARVAGRIARLLQRRGLGPEADPEETDSLIRNEPLLAALYGASVSGRTATGPRAGMCVTTAGNQIDAESPEVLAGPCCASVSGVNVHAGVCVPARDRVRLERLSRYTARPPLALERLSLLPDGRLLCRSSAAGGMERRTSSLNRLSSPRSFRARDSTWSGIMWSSDLCGFRRLRPANKGSRA